MGNMRCRFRVFIVSAIVLIIAAAARAGDVEVGVLGDPANILWVGVQTVPAEQLVRALRHDTAYQVASTPSAPRDPFIEILRQRLEQGYLYSGFPQAQVQVTLVDDHVRATINEGQRYQCSGIVVEGLPQRQQESLIAALSNRRPKQSLVKVSGAGKLTMATTVDPVETVDTNDPVWEVDTPVRFNELAVAGRERAVRQWLAAQGRMLAQFTVEVRLVEGRGVLDVNVTSEGPAMTIGQIVIKGLHRNDEQHVRACIGASEGEPMNLAVIQQVHQRLRDSGRFLKYDLTADPIADQPGRTVLTLDLKENPKGPALDEELSDTEQAAMKLITWLNGWADRADDLVIESHNGWFAGGRMIISPRMGAGFVYEPKAGADQIFDCGLMLAATQRQLLVDSAGMGLRGRFESPDEGRGFVLINELYVRADGKDPERPFTSTFGTAVKKFDNESADTGLWTVVDVMPAFALHLVHMHDVTAALDNGQLVIRSPDMVVRTDARTGELLEMSSVNDKGEIGMSIRSERGALKLLTTRMLQDLNDAPPSNDITAMALFGRGVQLVNRMFAHCTILKWPADQRRVISEAMDTLLSPGTFAALEAMLTQPKDEKHQRFRIPVGLDEMRGMLASPLAMLQVLMPYCDDLFERGTWPWTLSRESILVLSGRTKYTMAEVRRMLASEDVGPIGCLAVSRWLKMTQPALSRAFARMSRGKVTDEAFITDCHMLLNAEVGQGKVVMALLGNLQQMSDAEMAQLAQALPAEHGKWLKVLHEELAAAKQAGDALDQQMLDRIALRVWRGGLRDAVNAALEDLTREPTQPPPPAMQ